MVIFHSYVSLPEGKYVCLPEGSLGETDLGLFHEIIRCFPKPDAKTHPTVWSEKNPASLGRASSGSTVSFKNQILISEILSVYWSKPKILHNLVT